MRALLPLSWIYGAGVSIHRRAGLVPRRDENARPRIVSVGNLEAGGNGKTPLAILLLLEAEHDAVPAAYVSRGYGGAVGRTVVTCIPGRDVVPAVLPATRVLARGHAALARAVGDEGAVVCERAPAATLLFCADKRRALDAAATMGVARVVLDDAFQSWRVPRHRDIVLLDVNHPLDAGRLLPAGRLREAPAALARADAVVFNGASTRESLAAATERIRRWIRHDTRVAGMARRVVLTRGGVEVAPPAERVLAVSGIARPDGFVRSLSESGLTVAGREMFPDHHRYSARDVARIVERCRREEFSAVVTTEKDWVKLRDLVVGMDVWVARLEVSLFGDELPR